MIGGKYSAYRTFYPSKFALKRVSLKRPDVSARFAADVAVAEGPLPLASELNLLRVHVRPELLVRRELRDGCRHLRQRVIRVPVPCPELEAARTAVIGAELHVVRSVRNVDSLFRLHLRLNVVE